MKTMKIPLGMLVAAVLCPWSASAIAFTITGDSDTLLTGTFQSQFPLSSSGRGSDSGTFQSVYWSGSLSFFCRPDAGSYTSFASDFSARHSGAGSGVGTTLLGTSESIGTDAGRFTFQPYYWGNGEWFVVSGSWVDNGSGISASGTFRVTRYLASTLPENGSTVPLLSLALATLLLAGKIVAHKTNNLVEL